MIGVVVVSHSEKLAEGVVELSKMMMPDGNVMAAGGMDDGGLGTSFEKIMNAVETVSQGDGVIIFMDMGSAVMTAEMVVESFDSDKVILANCPVVEGTIVAVVGASMNDSLENILATVSDLSSYEKF